ncbi:hypothetical protein ACXYN8_13050 [Altererythrobacter sp. CAU 1778]
MAGAVTASMAIAEMREFANFTAAEQRYIRRSLDVGLERGDALVTWSRDAAERASIRQQDSVYQELACLRAIMPREPSLDGADDFLGGLARVTMFDLAQGRLASFAAYRFLYERLLGAEIRPWLPSAFCAAAAMPMLPSAQRKNLLQSISEAAATAPGWSERQPSFYPEFVAEAA